MTRKTDIPSDREELPPEVRRTAEAIESTSLFGDRVEVVIRHNGREYRLRKTRLGKLILTA